APQNINQILQNSRPPRQMSGRSNRLNYNPDVCFASEAALSVYIDGKRLYRRQHRLRQTKWAILDSNQ
ncbi:MAG: hypothetical protein AB1744_16200, partial [Candidatus Zixiibacteriota bacterium]